MYFNVLIYLILLPLVKCISTDKFKIENIPAPEYKKAVQQGILTLGNNLLKTLHNKGNNEENILISPINIFSGLNLLHVASAKKTFDELSATLNLKLVESRDHHNHSHIDEHMQHSDDKNHHHGSLSRAPYFGPSHIYCEALSLIIKQLENNGAQEQSNFKLTHQSFANGIYVQNGLPLNEDYVAMVKAHFPSTESKNLDFAGHSKEATDEINKFVSEKTKGQISELFNDPLDSTTVIALISTLYFNGKWKEKFHASKTKKEKFNTGLSEIEIDLMNDQKFVPFITNEQLKFEAIRLPYAGHEYELVYILPNVDTKIDKLIQNLQTDDLQTVFNDEGNVGKNVGVDYKIPKMKFSWKKSLKEPFIQQGLKSIFESADLRYLTNVTNIKVSDMKHASNIEIDEDGTKASAVFGSVMHLYSLPRTPTNPKKFYVNRPFLMFLYHIETNTVQFAALIQKPQY